MKKYVTLSFDDGRQDFYTHAFKVLQSYDMKASLHVISGWLDGTWKNDDVPKYIRPLSIEQIREMKKYGIEISSHGDRHVTNKNDFIISAKKLRDFGLTKGSRIGFALPKSNIPEDFELFKQCKELDYVRGGRSELSHDIRHKFYHLMYNISKKTYWYKKFQNCNINDIKLFDRLCLLSVPVLSVDSADTIIDFIDKMGDGWVIFMFHSISDVVHDIYEYQTDEFEKLVRELKKRISNGEIEVKTIGEMVSKHDKYATC